MSLLIKGMDMPKSCEYCNFISTFTTECGLGCRCEIGNFEFLDYSKKQDNCPLAEVPTPHGRLIDCERKTFPTEFRYNTTDYAKGWNACMKSVHTAPTIIEAEE